MRPTPCIPDQSCLSGGAGPADPRPDVVYMCNGMESMESIKSCTDGALQSKRKGTLGENSYFGFNAASIFFSLITAE